MSFLFLLIVAVMGLIIALISLFPEVSNLVSLVFPPVKTLNLTAFVLLIFSALGITISLERYEALKEAKEEAYKRHFEIIKAIDQVQKNIELDDQTLLHEVVEIYQTLMAASIMVKPLFGNKTYYEEAIRLLKACKGSEIIRATAFDIHRYSDLGYVSFQDSAYLETLAKTIGHAKQNKLGMVYKVVMGFRGYNLSEKGEPPPEGQYRIRKRRELFKQNNVLDRIEIRYLDNSWSLNFMIVDNEKMMIGFPTMAIDADLRVGLLINHKEFVESMVRWYDELLWKDAKILAWTGEEALKSPI